MLSILWILWNIESLCSFISAFDHFLESWLQRTVDVKFYVFIIVPVGGSCIIFRRGRCSCRSWLPWIHKDFNSFCSHSSLMAAVHAILLKSEYYYELRMAIQLRLGQWHFLSALIDVILLSPKLLNDYP